MQKKTCDFTSFKEPKSHPISSLDKDKKATSDTPKHDAEYIRYAQRKKQKKATERTVL